MTRATNYILITADYQITLVDSYDAGLAEAKKINGKCRLFKLDLVDVLNANKAGKPKPALPAPSPAKRKKAK